MAYSLDGVTGVTEMKDKTTDDEALWHDKLAQIIYGVWLNQGEQITDIRVQWIDVQRYGKPKELLIYSIQVNTETYKNFRL